MSKRATASSLVPWCSGPDDGIALACVPWAGAGAAPFRAWGAVFAGTDVTVLGVRLAGRESRVTERPQTDIGAMADELVTALLALPQRRMALFGQCSGALVAFEAARRLSEEGAVAVVHLAVAAQLAPADVAGAPATSVAALVEELPDAVRESAELVELLLPALEADVAAVDRYRHPPEPAPTLRCPVLAIRGTEDALVRREDLVAWQQHTAGPLAVRAVERGDHLLGDRWPEVGAIVRDALAPRG